MKIIFGIGKYNESFSSPAVAMGIFDGVHRGHQALIGAAVADAKKRGAKSVVMTFFPHPAHVLRPDIKLPYLNSLEQRFQQLERLGVDCVLVMEFTQELADLSSQEFVEQILKERLQAGHVFVGEDFRFGKGRDGDADVLKTLCANNQIEMTAIHPVEEGGLPISSSRLRKLIQAGDLNQAAILLGRSFSVQGKVVRGDGRGKQLGFPTANIEVNSDVLPPKGVYAVECGMGEKIYGGAMNIGVRPSFAGSVQKPVCEVYVLDFQGDLYAQTMEIVFKAFVRSEQTFSNADALSKQISQDVENVRMILRKAA